MPLAFSVCEIYLFHSRAHNTIGMLRYYLTDNNKQKPLELINLAKNRAVKLKSSSLDIFFNLLNLGEKILPPSTQFK